MAAPKNYKGVPMPSFFNPEGMKLFSEMEFEDDDVVMVSFVKAGTTWVNKIIHCLLRMDEQGKMEAIPGDLGASGQIYPEWLPEKVPEDPEWAGVGPGGLMGKICFADLVAQPRPRLFSTHLPGKLLPESLARRGRVVYVLRNPKDCLNSLHYFRGAAKDDWLGNEHGPGSLARFMSGVNAYGSFFDHVASTAEFIDNKCADRALTVYFEDLKLDIHGGIKQLAEFLKVPLTPDKLDAVYRATTFDAMSGGSAGKGVSQLLLRKGICGDWVSAPLSKAHWAQIDLAFEEKLGHIPIAWPLRPWLQPPPPAEALVEADDVPKARAAIHNLPCFCCLTYCVGLIEAPGGSKKKS
mmetsp:Transcript_42008/g.121804  ORF Transcript_42008/g.121804 Transcript_42008/m.121804 type:complete len:352 (-) Transcript_42008:292-1347(-)